MTILTELFHDLLDVCLEKIHEIEADIQSNFIDSSTGLNNRALYLLRLEELKELKTPFTEHRFHLNLMSNTIRMFGSDGRNIVWQVIAKKLLAIDPENAFFLHENLIVFLDTPENPLLQAALGAKIIPLTTEQRLMYIYEEMNKYDALVTSDPQVDIIDHRYPYKKDVPN